MLKLMPPANDLPAEWFAERLAAFAARVKKWFHRGSLVVSQLTDSITPPWQTAQQPVLNATTDSIKELDEPLNHNDVRLGALKANLRQRLIGITAVPSLSSLSGFKL